MNKLLAALLFFGCVPAFAQNVRVDVAFPSITNQGSVPFLIANMPPLSPILSVCHSPANGLPCTNYATTFTSLGVACPNGAQDTPQPQPSACQSSGDGQGNIGFWIPAGQYDYTVTIGNNSYGPYTITAGAGGIPGGNTTQVQFNCAGSFCGSNNLIFNSGTNTLTLLGTETITGNQNVTGLATLASATVSGPASFGSSTNKVLKVLDATAYSGSDIGAQITNAYASADCPATGCHIKIPTGIYGALGTWTTPIAFSTAAKPAYLECDQGGQGIIASPTGTTQLIYSGTGAAITFNTGGGTGAGMSGCTLTGPSSAGGTIGLLVGGNFGTTEGRFSNNDISGFGAGIQFGSNTYVTSFYDNVVHDNGKEVYAPSSITGFGENITFIGGDFYNKAGAQANGIDLEEAGDYHFIANSFDEAFITVAAPALQLDLVSPHFENPVASTTTDFLTMTSACTACRVSSTGGYWLEDGASSRTEFILDAGANSTVQLFGGGFTAAETVPQLVRFTGANASFFGMGLFNFQAEFTADSSGALESVSCSNTNFPSGCLANVAWAGPSFVGTGTGAEIASGTLSNTNLTGFCTFAGSITTCGPITFSGSHTNHPECEIQPQFDATAAGSIWPTYTGSTSMMINEHAYVAGSVSYHCDFKK